MAGIAPPNVRPPTRGRRFLGNLATSAITLLICFAASEFCLRQWFPIGVVTIQTDPRYLYKYIPNSRRWQVPPDTVWQTAKPLPRGAPLLIEFNAQGRRGDAISNARKERIVVYGDSFVAAYGTPVKQTFVSQLEQQLNQRLSKSLQAINAGVEGYGPDQESLVMEDEVASLKPELIVFSIYAGNDFGDLLRNKLFKLDDHDRLIPNRPAGLHLYDYQRPMFDGAPGQSRFQVLRRLKKVSDSLRGSKFVRSVKSFLHMRQNPLFPAGSNTESLQHYLWTRQDEYSSYILRGDNNVYNLFADTPDADLSLAPGADSSRYKRLLMDRMMARIEDIAASRCVPLVFLFIPAIENTIDEPIVDPKVFPEYSRSAQTDALEQIATERSFLYLDLFEPFRQRRSDGLYFADSHWNPAGQRLAATLMADYIVRHNLLAARTGACAAR